MKGTNSNKNAETTTLGEVVYPAARAASAESEWVALVRGMGGASQPALQAFYDRTHRLVFTYVVRIVRDIETSHEVVLDVFLEVWQRAAGYDASGGTVLGWVMNIARSRAIDRLRHQQRLKRAAPPLEEVTSEEGSTMMADPADLAERMRVLRSALDELSPEEREVIQAAFLSELTHTEVAARLNQPLGTVKTRIRSGVYKLRRALSTQMGEP